MSVVKLDERRQGPWLGCKTARPSRRQTDREPLFEPEQPAYRPREDFDPYQKETGAKKVLAAFGVFLIFISGLGAGAMLGWTGSEASREAEAVSAAAPTRGIAPRAPGAGE